MSMLMLRQASPGPSATRRAHWASPVTVPRPWAVATFTGCAMFAVAVALVTTDQRHRVWGIFAACSYVLAALAVMAWRSRGVDLALVISFCGALVAPLSLMVTNRLREPEVHVITKSGALLVTHGTVYPGLTALADAHTPNVFDPYLPLMTVFGLPRAVLGSSAATDPRVWFTIAFIGMFAGALAVGGARDVGRWTALVTACPVIAFSLSVGGTDIPVLAAQCLGLALLWRRPRPVLAGLALGAAAAMKATAWPALVVAGVLVAVRDGKRPVLAMSAAAAGVVAAVVGPVTALWPRSFVQNTIAFPLDLAKLKSDAVSPLPGRLLAETGHLGHMIAVVLLGLAGLSVLVSLVVRPPRTVPAATWRLAVALTLMFLLAPATRFGYFVYPLGLVIWLAISWLGERSGLDPPARASEGPGEKPEEGAGPGERSLPPGPAIPTRQPVNEGLADGGGALGPAVRT